MYVMMHSPSVVYFLQSLRYIKEQMEVTLNRKCESLIAVYEQISYLDILFVIRL